MVDAVGKQRRALSFGAVAQLYDRVRPGYPIDALRWLLPSRARRVVELGAGTGALTRSLLSLGLEVVAVEPDPQMREVLAERAPRAEVRAGSAEDIPIDTGEADAVVGGQMWHWVDVDPATTEVSRVLRSGGTLGLLWNLRDERVPWMSELGKLMGGEDRHGRPGEIMLSPGAPFEHRSSAEFPFTQELGADDLADFVASRSHVQVLELNERSALLGRVKDFADSHPELAGKKRLEVPYVTICWRALRT